jgi:hypothetical protein
MLKALITNDVSRLEENPLRPPLRGVNPLQPGSGPTTRLENKSITTARYNHPSAEGRYVMSLTHFRFGLIALKSRSSLFGATG